MAGAVHRFETKPLRLDFDRAEHILAEVFQVTRDFVEALAYDVRRDDRLIAAFAQTFTDEVLDDAADDGTFRMPKDETASRLLFDGVEIELGAELAMIARLRFFEAREIRFELRALVPR